MNINEETNSEEQKESDTDLANDEKNILQKESSTQDDDYKLGWNNYAELTNGRFAMIGFIAILLIELISNESFLKWANLLN
tara:strand:- start:275 stop:517 length:243 start_codon:yes stop_codon:yes gene_type:complete